MLNSDPNPSKLAEARKLKPSERIREIYHERYKIAPKDPMWWRWAMSILDYLDEKESINNPTSNAK